MTVHVVKVPDIGEGIAEVELVEWRVRPGDMVEADQPLADVMTDKATVEVPSPVAGKVIAAHGKAGDKLAVGSELARLETQPTSGAESGEYASGRPRESGDPATLIRTTLDSRVRGNDRIREVPPDRAGIAPGSTAPTMPTPNEKPLASNEKPLASPSVRRHARELDVDLSQVRGTGP